MWPFEVVFSQYLQILHTFNSSFFNVPANSTQHCYGILTFYNMIIKGVIYLNSYFGCTLLSKANIKKKFQVKRWIPKFDKDKKTDAEGGSAVRSEVCLASANISFLGHDKLTETEGRKLKYTMKGS